MLVACTGLNVVQWLANMKSEHCDVDPNNLESTSWGASTAFSTSLNPCCQVVTDSGQCSIPSLSLMCAMFVQVLPTVGGRRGTTAWKPGETTRECKYALIGLVNAEESLRCHLSGCSPRFEWHFAKDLTWDGKKVTETIGGFQKEGMNFTSTENMNVRRKASLQDSLF